jgi:hypothetical protein
MEASVPSLRKSLAESCTLLADSSILMSSLCATSSKTSMGLQNLQKSLVAQQLDEADLFRLELIPL